jgi:hypothetical protein
MPDPTRLNLLPEWAALAKHRDESGGTGLRELFADDPRRAERLTVRVGDDQWGVELGKVLARRIEPALTEGTDVPGLDASTTSLVTAYRTLRGR